MSFVRSDLCHDLTSYDLSYDRNDGHYRFLIRARAICELRKMSKIRKIKKIKKAKIHHICISFCECIKYAKCIKPSYLYEVEAKAMSCLRSMCVQRPSKLFRKHENTANMHNSCSLMSLQSMCVCARKDCVVSSQYV